MKLGTSYYILLIFIVRNYSILLGTIDILTLYLCIFFSSVECRCTNGIELRVSYDQVGI
jgi:hypothetical protein